jgi:hypothetical protein
MRFISHNRPPPPTVRDDARRGAARATQPQQPAATMPQTLPSP